MRVKDCMCNKTIYATPETNLNEVAKLMQTNDVGSIPICNNEKKILGLITDRDIIVRGVANNKDLNTTKAHEIMTTQVIRTSPDTDAGDAARTMSCNQIRRLPVIENDKLVGMLSIGDLAKGEDIPYGKIGITLEHICENTEE